MWDDTDRLKPKNSEKNGPSATLSTTYLTQTGTKSNTGLYGERSATKGPPRNVMEHNVEGPLHAPGVFISGTHQVLGRPQCLPESQQSRTNAKAELRKRRAWLQCKARCRILPRFCYTSAAAHPPHKHNNSSFPIPSRVFENTVLRRVFGPKKEEVTREWRKLHNEELNDL